LSSGRIQDSAMWGAEALWFNVQDGYLGAHL